MACAMLLRIWLVAATLQLGRSLAQAPSPPDQGSADDDRTDDGGWAQVRRDATVIMSPGPRNLPMLPSSHAPDHPNWTNSVALCTTMYNENVTDVREWLRYYRWLGVDHVYLTDNESDNSKEIRTQLALDFPRSFLTLRFRRRPAAQMPTYSWCVSALRGQYNWLMFLDVDEYLMLRPAAGGTSGGALKPFLDGYKHAGGLIVHWIMVGGSGRAARPEAGGVLRSYTQCVPDADERVKIIANTYFLRGLGNHPHSMHTGDVPPVNEHGVAVPPLWHPLSKHGLRGKPALWTKEDCVRGGDMPRPPPGIAEFCYLRPQASHAPPSADLVAIFHYAIKSEQDFAIKQARGGGMHGRQKTDDYALVINEAQRSVPLCEELLPVADECCSPAAVQLDADAAEVAALSVEAAPAALRPRRSRTIPPTALPQGAQDTLPEIRESDDPEARLDTEAEHGEDRGYPAADQQMPRWESLHATLQSPSGEELDVTVTITDDGGSGGRGRAFPAARQRLRDRSTEEALALAADAQALVLGAAARRRARSRRHGEAGVDALPKEDGVHASVTVDDAELEFIMLVASAVLAVAVLVSVGVVCLRRCCASGRKVPHLVRIGA